MTFLSIAADETVGLDLTMHGEKHTVRKMDKMEIVTRPTNFETLKVELGKMGVTSIPFQLYTAATYKRDIQG